MKSTPLGYLFTFLAFSVFAIQDGLSKHLGETHSPVQVAMVRYWAFVAFALFLAMRSSGGLSVAVNTKRPFLQVLRGLILFLQILISIVAFTQVGLAQSQAIFAAGPIFVALLSMPILGEKVGWRRWTAILFGLVGVVIMLAPSGDGFNSYIWLPLICAVLGAIYGIATRLVSRDDQPSTSFFYLAIVGFIGS
ncbi:DMT family transporter, partial [Rhizobium sp. AAP116]